MKARLIHWISRAGALAVTALLIGCGSSAAYRAPTDAAFQEMVLEVMPGYVLTEELLGRPVVRSPGYALELNPIGPPDEVFEEFIARHEADGLAPVIIDFNALGEGDDPRMEPFRAHFPGCAPGDCVAAIADTRFERISFEESLRYFAGASTTTSTHQEILRATIDSVDYLARLTILTDAEGRVIRYRVRSNRSAVTPREIAWARTTEIFVPADAPVATYSYVNNMALGVDGEGPAMNVGGLLDEERGL